MPNRKWNVLLLGGLLTLAAGAAWADDPALGNAPRIENGAEPSNGEVVLEVNQLWERGGEDDDMLFGVVGRILVDEDGLSYVLDQQLSEIHVFDEGGEWIQTMGREGEGPGEFQNAGDMFFSPGQAIAVAQMFPGKIVQLNRDGTPADGYDIGADGFVSTMRGRQLGDNLVLSGSESNFAEGQMQRMAFIREVAPDGTIGTVFTTEDNNVDFAKLEFSEVDLDGYTRHWTVTTDDRVVAAKHWDRYELTAWNADGSVDRVFTRGYEPTKRSDEEREEAASQFGININGRQATILTSEVERCVEEIYTRPDGVIWVEHDRSGDRHDEGILWELDEFDSEGNYTRRILIKAPGDTEDDGVVLQGDKLFVVRGLAAAQASLGGGDDEEEEESMDDYADPLSIVCYRLGG